MRMIKCGVGVVTNTVNWDSAMWEVSRTCSKRSMGTMCGFRCRSVLIIFVGCAVTIACGVGV